MNKGEDNCQKNETYFSKKLYTLPQFFTGTMTWTILWSNFAAKIKLNMAKISVRKNSQLRLPNPILCHFIYKTIFEYIEPKSLQITEKMLAFHQPQAFTQPVGVNFG